MGLTLDQLFKGRKRIKLKLNNEYSLIYDEYYETIDLIYEDRLTICTIWERHNPTIISKKHYDKLNNENNIITKCIINLFDLYFEEGNENNKKERKEIFNNLKNLILEKEKYNANSRNRNKKNKIKTR